VKLFGYTLGIGTSVASIASVATVIEMHFTLSRADGGMDSVFYLEMEEMKLLVRECNTAYQALGEVRYNTQEQEKKSLQFRRSLYITEDMKKGDVLTEKNMRSIRPGLGLPPKYYDVLMGKKVAKDVKRGTAVDWTMFE